MFTSLLSTFESLMRFGGLIWFSALVIILSIDTFMQSTGCAENFYNALLLSFYGGFTITIGAICIRLYLESIDALSDKILSICSHLDSDHSHFARTC